MSECTKIQELISALVDGEVSESEKTEIEKHIEACPECKAMFEAFTAVSESLFELEEVPENLHESIMREVKNEGRKKKSPWLKILPLAACFALVIFAAFSINGAEPDPSDNMLVGAVGTPVAETDSSEDETANSFAVNGSAEVILRGDSEAPALPEGAIAADRTKSYTVSAVSSEKIRELLTPVPDGESNSDNKTKEEPVQSLTVVFSNDDGDETVQVYFAGDTAYADFGDGLVEVTGTPDEISELLG